LPHPTPPPVLDLPLGQETDIHRVHGHPNVDKSSIISCLKKGRVCRVTPIPGQTKGSGIPGVKQTVGAIVVRNAFEGEDRDARGQEEKEKEAKGVAGDTGHEDEEAGNDEGNEVEESGEEEEEVLACADVFKPTANEAPPAGLERAARDDLHDKAHYSFG
ncbi:hypothetical protein FRC07_010418, partial [Ceratobasidium sp. 392]